MGIDCGTEFTGFGIAEQSDRDHLHYVVAGVITLSKKDPMPRRLAHIFATLRAVIDEHKPHIIAIEEVFYSVNPKSALKLGQVRGVAMLASAYCGLPMAEYSPLAIKSSVVGYGHAEKHQVQHMVMRLLRLEEVPASPDAADALAIAICHLHTSQTLARQAAGNR
ncbi:MAG TPA: crossover junction endodeoxyribonuclease RuvC [Terriglobales bacterium]|nr:crossover junction endodeoxyribonuclease RuvC [Terriglobales bacterium]